MTVLQLGDIAVQRIVEHEIPVYRPSEMFEEATPEALEPYRNGSSRKHCVRGLAV